MEDINQEDRQDQKEIKNDRQKNERISLKNLSMRRSTKDFIATLQDGKASSKQLVIDLTSHVGLNHFIEDRVRFNKAR